MMVAWWFVLVISGLVIFGLVAILRKVGVRNVLLNCLLVLPLLAVAGILLALVSYRSVSMHSAQVERMQQIDVQKAQVMAQVDQRHELFSQPQIVTDSIDSAEHPVTGIVPPPTPTEASQPPQSHTELTASELHKQINLSRSEQIQAQSMMHDPEPRIRIKKDLAFLTLGAVFFMLAVAVIIGIPVYLSAQGGSLQWRTVGANVLSMIWILPILAVVAVPLGIVTAKISHSTGQVVAPIPTPTASDMPHDEIQHKLVSQESPDENGLPQWVHEPPHIDGDERIFVLVSGPSAAVDDSETQAAITRTQTEVHDKGVGLIRAYFNEVFPITNDWPVPDAVVRRAYGNVYQEVKDGEFDSKVYRRYVQLKLTPEIRARMLRPWQAAKAQDHLIALCTALGVITLLLGTTAAYLRLDGMTQGAYRGRLKLASLSLITAGSLVAGLFLA